MKRQNLIQFYQFIRLFGGDYSAWVITDNFLKLQKCSKKLSALDTKMCNGEISDYNYDMKSKRVFDTIDELFLPVSLFYHHQSDPRGASLYISNQYIDASNYNNGVAIY